MKEKEMQILVDEVVHDVLAAFQRAELLLSRLPNEEASALWRFVKRRQLRLKKVVVH